MNEQKKILISLAALHDPGGVAAFYNAILPHLRNGRYDIKTLEIGSTKGRGNKIYPITDQLRFYQALRKDAPVLVHINPSLDLKSFLRDGLLAYQAKLKKLPVLVFFHGWRKDFELIISKRLLWFFRYTLGQADGFVVLAKEAKNVLKKWGVRQPIYQGSTTVDESMLASFSISEKLEQIKTTPTIKLLFLARLHREKGVFETVEAFSLLMQKKLSVTLTLAGDGPIIGDLRRYVKDLNLPEESINFLGYVKNAHKIKTFTNHHVYCLPSYSEGLPTSVLEAMAFGLPVITSPVGGLADIFQDGKMGFLCQGRAPAEIAFALEKLITNRSLLLQQCMFNYNFAQKHFMAQVVARNLLAIYQNTISAKKSNYSCVE